MLGSLPESRDKRTNEHQTGRVYSLSSNSNLSRVEHIFTWYLDSFEGRNNIDVIELLMIAEGEYITGSNWTSEKMTPEDIYK